MSRLALISVFASSLLAGAAAEASCHIHNDTGYSFTIESGNTSNQSVGGHATTSIAAGTIIGKSSEGKTVGGSCQDGQSVEIVEKSGVTMIVPAK